jgi:hypothetical protein
VVINMGILKRIMIFHIAHHNSQAGVALRGKTNRKTAASLPFTLSVASDATSHLTKDLHHIATGEMITSNKMKRKS